MLLSFLIFSHEDTSLQRKQLVTQEYALSCRLSISCGNDDKKNDDDDIDDNDDDCDDDNIDDNGSAAVTQCHKIKIDWATTECGETESDEKWQ